MGHVVINKLPIEKEIKKEYSLNEKERKTKQSIDKEIMNILNGQTDKIIVIVGPCSIDNTDIACEYARKLAKIQEKVKDKIRIVMRAYSTKPRSIVTCYKGMIHSPNPIGEENISLGIKKVRETHVKIFKQTRLPIADELVYPEVYKYLDDIVSYFTIGARSVENQEHRLIASAINQPVGFKNPLSGNINNVIDAIISARHSNNCIYGENEIKTSGNLLTNLILRGYTNNKNKHFKNCESNNLMETIELLSNNGLENVPIIIDASHSNSGKDSKQQQNVIDDVLESIKKYPLIKKYIKGFMIESYIYEGNQEVQKDYIIGKSLTDSCISIEETERILLKIAEGI